MPWILPIDLWFAHCWWNPLGIWKIIADLIICIPTLSSNTVLIPSYIKPWCFLKFSPVSAGCAPTDGPWNVSPPSTTASAKPSAFFASGRRNTRRAGGGSGVSDAWPGAGAGCCGDCGAKDGKSSGRRGVKVEVRRHFPDVDLAPEARKSATSFLFWPILFSIFIGHFSRPFFWALSFDQCRGQAPEETAARILELLKGAQVFVSVRNWGKPTKKQPEKHPNILGEKMPTAADILMSVKWSETSGDGGPTFSSERSCKETTLESWRRCRWRNTWKYHKDSQGSICNLCKVLQSDVFSSENWVYITFDICNSLEEYRGQWQPKPNGAQTGHEAKPLLWLHRKQWEHRKEDMKICGLTNIASEFLQIPECGYLLDATCAGHGVVPQDRLFISYALVSKDHDLGLARKFGTIHILTSQKAAWLYKHYFAG